MDGGQHLPAFVRMSNATGVPVQDATLASGLLQRSARELSVLMGRELEVQVRGVERTHARPVGHGTIHISFKLGVGKSGGPLRQGALLVPLPEAIAMACFLLMVPDEVVAARRTETNLDAGMKDALLEIGTMLGGACNNALTGLGLGTWTIRSEGCQGVRADVRPALEYREGDELIVCRAQARLEPFGPFPLILILPPVS